MAGNYILPFECSSDLKICRGNFQFGLLKEKAKFYLKALERKIFFGVLDLRTKQKLSKKHFILTYKQALYFNQ